MTIFPQDRLSALFIHLTFEESMVYAEELLRGKRRAVELAHFDEREPVKAIQLIGRDPQVFRQLCERQLLSGMDLIDINMGCSVPEIVKSGRGCALVHDLSLAARIIEAYEQIKQWNEVPVPEYV